MQYTWDSQAAFEMAALPKAAAGHLKLASPLQLRVLLWLCCVGQGRFDAAACGVACGASPELCEEALAYWAENGIVVLQGVPQKGMNAPVAIPASVAITPEVPAQTPATPIAFAEKPQAALRPSRTDVMQTMEEDAAFYFMVQTVGSKLGKAITDNDQAALLYLYRDCALPPEVILLVVGYAVKNGKGNMAYVEQTALNWVKEGINTIAAADAHLCHLEHCREAWERVCRIGDLQVARPRITHKEMVCRWVYEWGMPDEVIEVALAYTLEKKGKTALPYTDALLEDLHEQGITTASAAKEALEPKKPTKKPKNGGRMKTAKDRPPSFDLGEYEELALRHRPQLPPQEE